MSKDVTLTRLLLVGIFAFGLKKKSKTVTNYLVIDYDCGGGIKTSAIFKGEAVPKLNSELLKFRMLYAKKAEKLAIKKAKKETESDNMNISSSADEIAKFKKLLDDGVITQEEFDKKKRQLLDI